MDHQVFPPLPALQAEGIPVYFAPVVLSGERLCVLLVSQSNKGDWDIAEVMNAQQRECLFGDHADGVSNLIKVCRSSLETHLESGKSLEEWTPNMSGFFAGEMVRAHVDDLLMMRRTLARSSSALSWSTDVTQ